MINEYQSGVLRTASEWASLRASLDPNEASGFLTGLLEAFREAGGVYYILERSYADRDYTRAYAAFYHKAHAPHARHCARLHVFSQDLSAIEKLDAAGLAARLEEAGRTCYLGCAVLRPVAHAPVSWAIVTTAAAHGEAVEIHARTEHVVHLMGAELRVVGAPATEQDSRTGSCAQAAIWGAARNLHLRRGTPWWSVVDITAAAMTPTDADIATSLPAGSARLTQDAMVRAMKGMGLHPLVYRPGKTGWHEPPHRIVGRYLDSGIPVIIGMDAEGEHAVLAVGVEGHRTVGDRAVARSGTDPDGSAIAPSGSLGPTTSDLLTHFIVNDDQAGPYRRLAIHAGDMAPNGYPWCLDQATFVLPALPESVFMKADFAEVVAREQVAELVAHGVHYASLANVPDRVPAVVDPEFHSRPDRLVARTYLTQGWKYAHRMLRNDAPEQLKTQLMRNTMPRHVWVTEFCMPEDLADPDPCARRVRGHIVVDPTAGPLLDSVVIAHVPGILMTTSHDHGAPGEVEVLLSILPEDRPYRPKVRVLISAES